MIFYQIYKYLVYIPWLLVWTAINFSGVVLVAPFSPRMASRWFGGIWGRGLMYGVPASLEVFGAETLDRQRPCIVVANHLSLMDIPILYGWLMLDFKWVMKKELRHVPLIGPGCALMGHIFLDRSDRDVAIAQLREVKRDLLPGTSILFFPEGTRSRDGKMQAFKKGAFQMAKDLDVDILPVTICNAQKILPPDGMGLRPGSAQMIIHPVIDVDIVRSHSPEQLRDMARDIVASVDGVE